MNFLTVKKVGKDNELIHINLNNVGFFKINEESENGLILEVTYRKKATEKLIEFKTAQNKENFRKFLANYKFYLLEKYFINVRAIDFVDEEFVDLSTIKLNFYFKDGQYITFKTQRARWENWRKLRLV
jgi:hypothetical protein